MREHHRPYSINSVGSKSNSKKSYSKRDHLLRQKIIQEFIKKHQFSLKLVTVNVKFC